MRAYLTAYLQQLEALLAAENPDENYELLLEKHLQMTAFMQHERLIHFLVTMLFAIGFFLVLGFFLMTDQKLMLGALLILILSLLIPYIMHYYFLENSVQKMYKQYDEMIRRREAQKQKTT